MTFKDTYFMFLYLSVDDIYKYLNLITHSINLSLTSVYTECLFFSLEILFPDET